jgi:ComEC/Rec2-related protein
VLPLLWCLAWCCGVALEIARPSVTSAFVPAGLAAGAAALAWSMWRRRGQGRVLVVVAAFLAGMARARAEGEGRAEAGETGLVRVMVRGASAPAGDGCSLLAGPGNDDVLWLLRVPAEICPLAAGEQVYVRARDLSPRRGAPWPGAMNFDPRGEGASDSFAVEHAWRASPAGAGYWRSVAELRHAAVAAGREAPALGFVVASVLGQPAALDPQRRVELRRAGLGHVVAVSGMNVAIAAALVRAPLLRVGMLFGGSLWLAALLSWAPIGAYLGLTGGEPPALRAAVMFALAQAAALVGRPAHGMTALAISAAALLAFRPAWALDPGLHLSLAAMAVLVHPEAPRGLIAQSWRVACGTLPIALVHFGSAALIGVVANVVAVPVFTLWVLPLGVIGLLLMPWCGIEGLEAACLGGQVIIDVAALAARAPEVPIEGLIAVAAVGMVARGKWVPGRITCAAVIVAGMWSRPEARAEPVGWAALGTVRNAAVIVPATSDGRLACVRDPGLAPEAWPELLAALGYRGAAEVEARRSPPAAAAVRAELERVGMMAAGTCPEGPTLKSLKPALTRCLARVGGKRAVVREGWWGAECWDGEQFVPLGEG